MKKQVVIKYIVFLLLSLFVASCSTSKMLRRTDNAYEIGEYHKALNRYRKLYRKVKDKDKRAEIQFKIAEAYKYIGNYKRAEIYYKNAIARGYGNTVAKLHYADVLRANEKFEESIVYYNAYLDSFPEDQYAINGLKSCNLIIEWENNPSRFEIENVKSLNSNASDFAAVHSRRRDNVVYFTSSRKGGVGRKTSPITGQLHTDIFISHYNVQRGKWDKPALVDKSFTINTSEDEGVTSFDPAGTEMYFTRCRYDNTQHVGAEIYSSTLSSGQWQEPVRVELTEDSLLAAHPSLSNDGNKLYFVSDMPGGYGGKDIWVVERGPGSWGEPVNLGPEINTPGDEMFPFERDNGELYFASDFHPGMGGLDIFKAVKNSSGKWEVENLKPPINSFGDDFSIYFIPGKDKGLFSSNRHGTRGDDIFSFILPPIVYIAEGEVFNKDDNSLIKNVIVRLIGTDGTMVRQNSSNKKFRFRLNPDTEYIVAAYKKGYLNAKATISTIGLDRSKNFNIMLGLTPTKDTINVDNIYFEFEKWDLLDESLNALDTLVSIMEANPTVTIELMAHTDCRGNELFNSRLSQKRAQSVVDYLIARGVSSKRLSARGYGDTVPKKVPKKLADKHGFLEEGSKLTCSFISGLADERQREICHQINRRIEFRIVSADYKETYTADP